MQDDYTIRYTLEFLEANPIITFIKKLLKRQRAAENKSTPIDTRFMIQRSQHQVSKTNISANALAVLNRLNSAGFEAYLVGGSVRDLLLKKTPKDFDIATNAKPQEVRKIFRNARIIGRRFKLVHILFHREIIEVATFRGQEAVDEEDHQTNDKGMIIRDNVYGTLEEDVFRRDFTINALYYTIATNTIVDFAGGFADIKKRTLRIMGDPLIRYQEDPVRMLRAIRFSAKLDFQISEETAAPIKQLNGLIAHVSSSRLFEEMVKLFQCGKAVAVQPLLIEYGLFALLFSKTHALLTSTYPVSDFIHIALQNTDKRIMEEKPVTPAFIFAVLLWFPLLVCHEELKKEGVEPLPALDQAMSMVLAEQNKIVLIPKRFTQVIREIWLLQFRFDKRLGHRAFHLLEHPRFRAAYDFLALRAIAGDAPIALADWWTTFQETTPKIQQDMIHTLTAMESKKGKV